HRVSAIGTPIGSVLGSLTADKNSDTTATGAGGQLTWTYTVADSAVEFLAASQTKVESFTITLNDQNGGVITQTIAVTITGTNDRSEERRVGKDGSATELTTQPGKTTQSERSAITLPDVKPTKA